MLTISAVETNYYQEVTSTYIECYSCDGKMRRKNLCSRVCAIYYCFVYHNNEGIWRMYLAYNCWSVIVCKQKSKRKNMRNRHEKRQALHSLAPYEKKVANIHTMTVKWNRSRVLALPLSRTGFSLLLLLLVAMNKVSNYEWIWMGRLIKRQLIDF